MIPKYPRSQRPLPIVKWVESFTDYLNRCIGTRFLPLLYVIYLSEIFDPVCLPLKNDQPYSEFRDFIKGDMVARESHASGLFKTDSAMVYYKLEEATRTTTYAALITPFQRRNDGHAAFLAL